MRRHFLLGVTSVATLLLTAATGCAGNPMSEEAIQRTVEDVIAANMAVETVSFELETNQRMSIVSSGQTSDLSATGTGSGYVDKRNRTMHLTMTTRALGPVAGESCTEMFAADGWMYVSVVIPGEEPQWMKMRMPEGLREQQDQDQQQVELLKAADEVNYLGVEQVDGVECYVVEIVPDIESVRQTMAQMQGQVPAVGGIDLGALQLGDMVKQVSMTQYIAVDGYLFRRTDERILIELTPEMLGITDGDFDVMEGDISTTLVFSDYNEPATIQLPQGALAATQIGA